MLAAAAACVGGCSITGPDETPWQSVSNFAWPINSDTVHYFHEEYDTDSKDTLTYVMDVEKDSGTLFEGRPMYRLDLRQRANDIRFLPLEDTLVIKEGNSWDCAFDADNNPTWRATILERFSYRNVKGTIYKNVIEVEYKQIAPTVADASYSWVRFFAEGVGVVQTIKVVHILTAGQGVPNKEEPTVVWTLIPS
jgi:hypothetical protein